MEENIDFRRTYLTGAQLEGQLRAWADADPDFVRLESAGKSRDGAPLHVLVIGRDPDRIRPAAWLDGNMHASELAGSSVCMAVAQDLITLHQGGTPKGWDPPPHLAEALRESLFYIMPRMAPDGADEVLRTGRYVRSCPGDHRTHTPLSRWVAEDIDGDGRALLMRVQDPQGEFVESSERPGVMVLRELEDTGPFYKLYPEGHIEGFDGHSIPAPYYLADNYPDLNRNFPYHWAPESQQAGAGPYPLSEPETQAVVAYTTARPHLFVWLNLHCFGGVHIRPLGGGRDTEMKPYDRAVYRQLEAWAEADTGYPMVSGFEEFTYEEGKALHGDLVDYAYHQRGCLTWVCELWDIFEQLGLERTPRFVDRYARLERADYEALAAWDQTHNEGRLFPPWVPVEHPQLGAVEVGGLDPRFGIWNPPPDALETICEGQSRLFLKAAALMPRLQLRERARRPLADGLWALDVEVSNVGYLPTNGVDAAAEEVFNEPVRLSAEGHALTVVGGQAREDVGHLRGWGHGRQSGFGSLFMQRSAGSDGRAVRTFVVRPEGEGAALVVRAGSSRTGYVAQRFDVPT